MVFEDGQLVRYMKELNDLLRLGNAIIFTVVAAKIYELQISLIWLLQLTGNSYSNDERGYYHDISIG
jgi:hypothetical protein